MIMQADELIARLIEGALGAHPAPHPQAADSLDFSDPSCAAAAPLAPSEDVAQIDPALIETCTKLPQNDTGNGQRLLTYFGSDLLHVRDIGWHAWDGRRWQREGGEEVAILHAQRTAPRIALEADHIGATLPEKRVIDAADAAEWQLIALEKSRAEWTDLDKVRAADLQRMIDARNAARVAIGKRQTARHKFAVSSGNAARIRAMLDQARPHCSAAPNELDADPLAFNVENGTLYFVRVEDEESDPDAPCYRWHVKLRPHDRAALVSRLAPVSYDPAAQCPTFMASLERFQPNENVRRFLQCYHGYALTGLTGEQCLAFYYGNGSNWKSTFLEIISRVMGDYATSLNFESLTGENPRSGSQASPDIARLPGRRLVRASEPERGVHFKEGLIKSLTSGEPLLTRHNFKDFFEFRPVFKLALSGNHKPQIGGVDHGIWRRIRFVLWPVRIEDAERRDMDEVIDGALRYLVQGLETPQEVIDATETYREETDPVGSFIADCATEHQVPEGVDREKPLVDVPSDSTSSAV
jgi:putative DNA primase/helicase